MKILLTGKNGQVGSELVGANKGDLLNLAALGGIFGGEKQGKKSYKILDTSVIMS